MNRQPSRPVARSAGSFAEARFWLGMGISLGGLAALVTQGAQLLR